MAKAENITVTVKPSWPHFWKGFFDGTSLALAILVSIALLVAVVAWWTVLPTVGFLWLVGAL